MENKFKDYYRGGESTAAAFLTFGILETYNKFKNTKIVDKSVKDMSALAKNSI